jgi:CelD/BcsL family acetyltransferase involved in cellulose biosynthesis
MRTTRPGVGPFRVRILRFLGADPYITEQPVSLADPARAAEIGLACAQSVSHERDWDWVQWRGLLRGDPFSEAVVEHLGVEIRGEEPANLLHVGTRWETFRASRKRNIKESLRRGYNSLKREGIAFRLHVHEAPSDVRPALASFFDLHARRAELAGTVPHPNRFPSERSRQFLEEVCMRFAEQRALRIFQLEIAGEPVAMRVAFATPRALYLYYSGYDPRFRRYGVMTTLVAEAIQYAISKRIPRVHLSMGADVSKSRWGPEMPLYCDGVAVRPSVIAHAKWRSVQLARKARALGFFGVE